MIDAVEPWKALLNPEANVEQLRTTHHGHILVRPIGITAFVGAIATAPDDMPVDHIRTVESQFHDLDADPWRGVLWNSATKKMNVTVETEKLARRLWCYLLGLQEDSARLEADWGAVVEPGNAGRGRKLPDKPS